MTRLNDAIYSDELQHPALNSSIIDDNEGVALALTSDKGLVRTDGSRENEVDIPVGMVVTDRRIIFAAIRSDGSAAGEITYDELAGIDREGRTLVMTATDGTSWRFPLTHPDRPPVQIAIRHLCWIGEVRTQVVQLSNDIELAVGRIGSLSNDLDWETAIETYRETREALDALITTVDLTNVLRERVLAPELGEMSRKLETACTRLFISRAESQLELTSQLIGYEDFDQARSAFQEAQRYYRRAQWHSDEIQRADSFQFGEQRELQHELDELQWDIETVAAEPLQQANLSKVEAKSAETLEEKIEHWEGTLSQYRGVVELAEGDSNFVSDVESAKAELQETKQELIELHERAARTLWNDGSALEDDGKVVSALKTCSTALDHLERAHDLAKNVDTTRAAELEGQLKSMFELYLMRERAGSDSTDKPPEEVPDAIDERELEAPAKAAEQGVDAESEGSEEHASEESSSSDGPSLGDDQSAPIPSLDDLSEIDTHHDIALELEDTDETSADETDPAAEDDPDSETQVYSSEGN
jgi:hypothetical protein